MASPALPAWQVPAWQVPGQQPAPRPPYPAPPARPPHAVRQLARACTLKPIAVSTASAGDGRPSGSARGRQHKGGCK